MNDSGVMLVEIEDDQLVKLDEDDLTRMGNAVIAHFRKRRNLLICGRDGHTWDAEYGKVCTRCHELNMPSLQEKPIA